MPTMTGLEVVSTAFSVLNIYMPNETPSANDAEFARGVLNRMLSGWRQRTLLIPVVVRERFDLQANKGGPTNPYTIGDGGDFDTGRPPNQNSVQAANLILTATSPEVRIPLGIYTDDAYFANKLPSMSNTQPTSLYYNPTYTAGLGSIYLWPVPTTATNDIELLLQKPLASFDDLDTEYQVPDGMDDALVNNLVPRLATPYGRPVDPEMRQLAASSLSIVKAANMKLTDLPNDAQFGSYTRTLYNINTGS